MSDLTPEQAEQKRKQLEALLNQTAQPQPIPSDGAKQDISSMERWGAQDPNLLANLGNPNYQPSDRDLALAGQWRSQDPELFNSLLPEAPQLQTLEVNSVPWLKPVLIGGGILIAVLLGSVAVGMVAGGEKQTAEQSAIATPSPSPVVTPSPTPTPQQLPLQPDQPDLPSDLINPHRVVGAGDCLNVRDHNGNIKGCLPVGAIVSVTGYSGDWAITEYQGKAAFLSRFYLQMIGQDKTGNLSGKTLP